MAASKPESREITGEKRHAFKDPFTDPWVLLETGKNLATAAALFAAAGPPYLVLKGLLAFLEHSTASITTGLKDTTAQGTDDVAELPPPALRAELAGCSNIKVPADADINGDSMADAVEAVLSSPPEVTAAPTSIGSIVTSTAEGSATAEQFSEADQSQTSGSNGNPTEDGPDTPPLVSPRPPREAPEQDFPAAAAPEDKKVHCPAAEQDLPAAAAPEEKKEKGSTASKSKGPRRPVAAQTAEARGSKKGADPLKASRKLYKSLKTGQVALQRKDYASAMHHATKALEQNADNLDAINFRVTVLVAQRKAEAGRASTY